MSTGQTPPAYANERKIWQALLPTSFQFGIWSLTLWMVSFMLGRVILRTGPFCIDVVVNYQRRNQISTNCCTSLTLASQHTFQQHWTNKLWSTIEQSTTCKSSLTCMWWWYHPEHQDQVQAQGHETTIKSRTRSFETHLPSKRWQWAPYIFLKPDQNHEKRPYSIARVRRKKKTPDTAMDRRFRPTWSMSRPTDGFTTYQEAVNKEKRQARCRKEGHW